jgi:hypothetical protein
MIPAETIPGMGGGGDKGSMVERVNSSISGTFVTATMYPHLAQQ